MPNRLTMISILKDTAVVGAMFATGVVIDEKAMIPIGTLLTICGLVWWVGRKLQKIDDQLETIGEKLKHLPCETWNKCQIEEKDKKPLKML